MSRQERRRSRERVGHVRLMGRTHLAYYVVWVAAGFVLSKVVHHFSNSHWVMAIAMVIWIVLFALVERWRVG